MDKTTLIQQAKALLSASDLDAAFGLLFEFAEEHPEVDIDTFIHLKSRYNRAQSDKRKNVISPEAYELEISKTMDGVLGGLNALERPGPVLGKITTERGLWELIGLAAILGLVALGIYWAFNPFNALADQDTVNGRMRSDSATEAIVPGEGGQDNEKRLKGMPGTDIDHKNPATPDRETEKNAGRNPAGQSVSRNTSAPAEPKMEKAAAKIFKVTLMLNSNESDAAIYVNGEEAVVIEETHLLKTIEVKETEGNTLIELKRNGRVVCDIKRKVSGDMRIALPCD